MAGKGLLLLSVWWVVGTLVSIGLDDEDVFTELSDECAVLCRYRLSGLPT